jgi:glutamate-ammonia-ligase adenylyltransferase
MAHAWTWEHQALVRARLVVGSPALGKAFEQVRRRILCQPRNPTDLRDAVVSMRERIIRTRSTSTDDIFDFKLGRGGLIDIEFIVQFLMLRWAGEYPQLINSRRTRTVLHTLVSHHLLDPTLGATLSDIVERYLQMDNRFKLQEKLSQVSWSELTDERDAIANAWQKLITNSA